MRKDGYNIRRIFWPLPPAHLSGLIAEGGFAPGIRHSAPCAAPQFSAHHEFRGIPNKGPAKHKNKQKKQMHNTAMKRKHAALIRITARERNDEELTLALAYADRLEAEAELDDALAGVEPTMADHADVEQLVPVLGRIVCSGGVIKSVEHEWMDAQNDEAERRGIMLTWSWVKSLHLPDAGKCTYFYAGTRESGPLVSWSAIDGYWRRCRSTGNYGKNWACGGNWEIERIKPNDTPPDGAVPYKGLYVYETFEACNPDLCQAIQDVLNSQIHQEDGPRVARARAKLEAAKLRQIATRHRHRAEGYRRQASRPNRPGQQTEHAKNAAVQDALAGKFEARAALAESAI